MPDGQQIDYDALSKDATFLKMPLDQQRAYLSAIDKDFAGLDPESQKGYISHLTGVNVQSMEATPTSRAITALPTGQLRLRQDLGLPPEAPQSKVANEYQRESGTFAGAAAGAMAGGTAPTLLLRAGATALGSGTGALAGGATPAEAVKTGSAGAVLQPASELVGSVLSAAGKKLLAPLADKAGDFWSSVTGYTRALEEAKNANLSRYLAAEQKGAQAIAEGQANVAAVRTAQPQGQLGNWSDLNQSIGATPAKALRIGTGDIENASGIPGRGLEAEGFTKESMQKMAPPDQMTVLRPRLQAAGKAVQGIADKATENGVSLNAGKSAWNVINRINDPAAREQALNTFKMLAEDNGIQQQTGEKFFQYPANPTEMLALRQALGDKAKFGASGDYGSLASIRGALYRAVSGDLHDAVPDMKPVDMHYGDLKQAVDVVRQQTGKYMAGKWTPPQTAVQKAEAAVPELPKSSPYTPLPSSGSFTLDALKKLGIGAGVLGGGGLGGYALRRLTSTQP